ncbi:MAG: hypothetical protein M3O70_22740 [Actinomycetota bacterium]|nr:hypothetical protein [Actinomycetota bacterium]
MNKLVALAATVGILVVGCGGSKATAPAAQTTTPPTTAPSPTSGVPEVARAYLEAFAVGSPKMLEVSAPGSPAHVMTQTHLAGSEAALAEGHPYPPETVSFEGSTARTCFQGPPHSCYDYSNFEFDAAGRLVSFAVNGVPFAGRIVGGGRRPRQSERSSRLSARFRL